MNYPESIFTHSGGFDSTSKPRNNNKSSTPAETSTTNLQASKPTLDLTSQQPDPSHSLNPQSHFRPPPLPALKLPGAKIDCVLDGQVASATGPTSHPQETRGRSISNPEEKQLDSDTARKSNQGPVVRIAE